MEQLIRALPKTELHLHIEGSLEPELMFALADRNRIRLPYQSVEEVRKAYQFHNLQSFLDIYHQSAGVLTTTEDFYDLTMAYLKRVAGQNVRHVEIFFVPQLHTDRGIAFATVIEGIDRGLREGRTNLKVSSKLILCFQRHLSEEAAFTTLQAAEPYLDKIVGVGLESSERGHPPEKFARVFAKAHAMGLRIVAHAGEEGPPEYMWQAINLLHVERIDHGVRCLEDPTLVTYLKEHQIPLTVCPLSNIKLCVFKTLADHSLKKLLDHGLIATVNSDDPAYFGGYVEENFLACQKALALSKQDLYQLAHNGIAATFLTAAEKQVLFQDLAAVRECFGD